MPIELPPLPYPYDALEPHIDAQTMQLHHDKHHQAYVTNANAALDKHPEWATRTVEDILWSIKDVPEDIRNAIRNNLGQHSNHSIFWTVMGPGGGGNPNGRIADALKNTFGSYDAFKEQLSKAAVGQFGSGWAWLVADRQGKLSIKAFPNGDSPFMDELTPIFGVDVWEHAYYLKYQNRRADYVNAWFNTLNWDSINERFGRIWA